MELSSRSVTDKNPHVVWYYLILQPLWMQIFSLCLIWLTEPGSRFPALGSRNGSDRRLITIISQTANPPLQCSNAPSLHLAPWHFDSPVSESRNRGCQSSWGFDAQAQNSRLGSVAAYCVSRTAIGHVARELVVLEVPVLGSGYWVYIQWMWRCQWLRSVAKCSANCYAFASSEAPITNANRVVDDASDI